MKHLLAVWLLAFLVLPGCKKEGIPEAATSFGALVVKSSASTPEIAASFILKIDGVTLDTIRSGGSYRRAFQIETGNRSVTMVNSAGAEVFRDTVTIALQTTVELPGMMIKGQDLLVDDYDPAIIKPAPGKCLLRFINMDPKLPESVNIKLTALYYNYNFEPKSVPLNITVTNVSKKGFSTYVELDSPESILKGVGDDAFIFWYAMDVWDATSGVKLLESTFDTPVYLAFSNSGSTDFIPNNVISMGIPAAGNDPWRTCIVLFQRQL